MQAAAHDHIPVHPTMKTAAFSDTDKMEIPSAEDRPSVEEIIAEIEKAEWYRKQIVERRIFEAKEGNIGESCAHLNKSDQL